MPRLIPLAVLAILIAGCGSPSATKAPTSTPAAPRVATPTTAPAPTSAPAPTPVPTASPQYSAFLASLCRAFTAADTATLSADLPYFQYNSGLRFGMLGDGEGQTADPSLFSTWLQGSHVRCRYYTADVAGHGTLLTSGWAQPAAWSLIDLDTYNGKWKINDFTFGSQNSLWQAMQTSKPVVAYRE